jgi:hypothetical protein
VTDTICYSEEKGSSKRKTLSGIILNGEGWMFEELLDKWLGEVLK